ncbi:hypothetical protein [Myroides sp. WP-1]|uniref:hypothetical protein n=1 Tax=Myroides sp. WP-1 TaxID=2759944 RepID=UPI0015F980CF|nr:hypothetical protein [Myroides sp. WP-1]MBB1137956.1 hypothetical protein [Myroides sp. WP-1]
MPFLFIELDDKQLKKVKQIISDNGRLDLENETFSGSTLQIDMTPMGHDLLIHTHITVELGGVYLHLDPPKIGFTQKKNIFKQFNG